MREGINIVGSFSERNVYREWQRTVGSGLIRKNEGVGEIFHEYRPDGIFFEILRF